MEVTINHQPAMLAEDATLAQLAQARQIGTKGVAIAVNGEIVHAADWAQTTIHPHDDIIIIKAFCGG